MNLDEKDFKKVEDKMKEAIVEMRKIWIDPDYSSELDDRSWLVKCLEKDIEYLKRFFRKSI